jgi:hypothetical protein
MHRRIPLLSLNSYSRLSKNAAQRQQKLTQSRFTVFGRQNVHIKKCRGPRTMDMPVATLRYNVLTLQTVSALFIYMHTMLACWDSKVYDCENHSASMQRFSDM